MRPRSKAADVVRGVDFGCALRTGVRGVLVFFGVADFFVAVRFGAAGRRTGAFFRVGGGLRTGGFLRMGPVIRAKTSQVVDQR